ncbi:MAG: PAS domain S-box protein [Chloroflexi bacterium]|nr:PAS domain S-box protein [Chloroflexota bacterium]
MVETLFEVAPYAMVLIDQAGRMMQINAQVEVLFGYHRQELQAKPIQLLLPNCLPSWYTGPASRPLNEPLQTFQTELQGRHKDTGEFPVEIRLTSLLLPAPVAERDATPPHHLVAIFDLVSHKQRAAESAELHHRLHDRRIAEHMALAHKLHNEPLQDLQTLNFTLASLADTMNTAFESDPTAQSMAAMLAEVLQIRESIGHVSKQLRLLHQQLYPLALMSFGLIIALQAYVKSLQVDHPSLHIELKLPTAELDLPLPLRLALYHVCQQALKNIEQHADAHHVEIRLQAQDEEIILEIIDDGCGFDVPPTWITIVRQGHLGLSSAQERIEAVGGRFYVWSAPMRGTTIRVVASIKSTDPIY